MPAPIPVATAMRESSGPEFEQPSEQRAEPGADLPGRPLAPARAARADRQRRGEQLHDDRAEPDPARVVMHGGNRRVGAVTLRLGREGEHEHATRQPSQRCDQRERPRVRRSRRAERMALAVGSRSGVAGESSQQKMRAEQQRSIEHDRAGAGDCSDRYPEDDPTAQIRGLRNPSRASSQQRCAPHRSHPLLQSWSRTSPAASASR